MFYRKIYPNSWKLLKDNWILVFFGLFAYMLGFNELILLYSLGGSGADMLASLFQSFYESLYVVSLSQMTLSNLNILAILGVIFMLYAALIIMAVSSQGALIASTKIKKTLSFKERLRKGVDKFWPLLTVNLLNTIIGYFFVVIIIDQLIYVVANYNIDWLSDLLMSIIIFFIFIPFIIAISFVTRYCASYIVLEDQDVDTAFMNGWRLFRVNWLITIENALFLLLITLVYFALMQTVKNYFMFFVVTTFPYLGIGAINLLNGTIFLIGSALYAAYYNILWTNVFLELTDGKKKHSKIHRVTAKTLPRLAK